MEFAEVVEDIRVIRYVGFPLLDRFERGRRNTLYLYMHSQSNRDLCSPTPTRLDPIGGNLPPPVSMLPAATCHPMRYGRICAQRPRLAPYVGQKMSRKRGPLSFVLSFVVSLVRYTSSGKGHVGI